MHCRIDETISHSHINFWQAEKKKMKKKTVWKIWSTFICFEMNFYLFYSFWHKFHNEHVVSLWRYRHFSQHVWRRRKDLYVRLHIIAVSRKQGMCQNLLSLFLAEIVSKWFKSSSSIIFKIEIIIMLANLNVVLETFLFLLVDFVGFFFGQKF